MVHFVHVNILNLQKNIAKKAKKRSRVHSASMHKHNASCVAFTNKVKQANIPLPTECFSNETKTTAARIHILSVAYTHSLLTSANILASKLFTFRVFFNYRVHFTLRLSYSFSLLRAAVKKVQSHSHGRFQNKTHQQSSICVLQMRR